VAGCVPVLPLGGTDESPDVSQRVGVDPAGARHRFHAAATPLSNVRGIGRATTDPKFARLSDPQPLCRFDASGVHSDRHSKLDAFQVVTKVVTGRIPGTGPS
jgi:hypothetical protein